MIKLLIKNGESTLDLLVFDISLVKCFPGLRMVDKWLQPHILMMIKSRDDFY